jgi:hypothetical protein
VGPAASRDAAVDDRSRIAPVAVKGVEITSATPGPKSLAPGKSGFFNEMGQGGGRPPEASKIFRRNLEQKNPDF